MRASIGTAEPELPFVGVQTRRRSRYNAKRFETGFYGAVVALRRVGFAVYRAGENHKVIDTRGRSRLVDHAGLIALAAAYAR